MWCGTFVVDMIFFILVCNIRVYIFVCIKAKNLIKDANQPLSFKIFQKIRYLNKRCQISINFTLALTLTKPHLASYRVPISPRRSQVGYGVLPSYLPSHRSSPGAPITRTGDPAPPDSLEFIQSLTSSLAIQTPVSPRLGHMSQRNPSSLTISYNKIYRGGCSFWCKSFHVNKSDRWRLFIIRFRLLLIHPFPCFGCYRFCIVHGWRDFPWA